jgi:pyruvate-formate lyase-activating enzyme
MFDVKGGIPYGQNIAVSVTNACPLKCKHCITKSGPRTAGVGADFEGALENFLRRNDLGPSSVTFTGGEPFYDFERLKTFVKIVANRGIAVGAITSAFWAKSTEKALDILKQIPDLTFLTLSTDVHHSEFVPREFVRNAYIAAKKAGMRARVRLCVQIPHTEDDRAFLAFVNSFCAEEELEIQQVIPYGRAGHHAEFRDQEFRQQSYCPALGPHLLNSEEIIPCCNSIVPLRGKHPLFIGMGRDQGLLSDSILDNILFVTLKVWGVDEISEYLYQSKSTKSACDVCSDVCSDSSKWEKLQLFLERPEHRVRTYSFALMHLGVAGAESRLKKAIADYMAERNADRQKW